MPIRSTTLVLLTAFFLFNQQATIRTTVPLVVLPTDVTDRQGKPIPGLTSADFALFDNSRPKPVNVDTVDAGLSPIALVILVQLAVCLFPH